MGTDNKASPRRFYSRPADQSFAAYRDFILGMIAALGAKNDLTEEKLLAGWRRFWAAAESEAHD